MHASCSGCSLCLLVCPVWHQTADVRLTPHGRSKAQQHGADAGVLAASVAACTACGACEPICPESMPLMDMLLALRRETPLAPAISWSSANAAPLSARRALLPGSALRASPARLQRTLTMLGAGWAVAEDDGSDIALALEAGVAVPDERRQRFLGHFAKVKNAVVADGLLLRQLRAWLPALEMQSLGEALTRNPHVRAKLQPGDLYVIEPRAFHGDHARLVGHYDALREERGCATNLDLQRMAIPTTASSAQNTLGRPGLDVKRQVQWILEGLKVDRVIVEDLSDCAAFSACGRPVMHLGDL